MSRPDYRAVQATAIVSFKQFNCVSKDKAKVQEPSIQAMPSEHIKKQTQVEDTEMVDAESAESRKALPSKHECSIVARLSSPTVREKTETTITSTVKPQLEQEHAVDVAPQSTASSLKTIQEQMQEIKDLREVLYSVCLEREKLITHDIPAHKRTIARLESDLSRSNSEKVEYLEQQVCEWRNQAEASEQKASTIQRRLKDVENDHQKLCDELNKLSEHIQHPILCVDSERGGRERLEATRVLSQENDGMIEQREALVREKENLSNECFGWRKNFEELDRKYETLKDEKLVLQKKLADHKESSERAISENKALQARIDQQELKVTKAQNAAMSVLSDSLSATLPDDIIRRRFGQLFESVAEWARDNAAPPAQAIFKHPENIQRWQKDGLLREIGVADSSPNLNFDFQDDTAVDTLLNAALARSFCQDFLQNPFWFAQKSGSLFRRSSQNNQFGTNAILEKMLKMMMRYHEGDVANVHAWRASTVQTFACSDHARKKISASHRQYLDELLPQYGELIRTPLSQSDRDELAAIIKSFADFAIELWSQKMEISCYHLDTFEDYVYRQADEHMEIARAVGVDDGDMSLVGKPIPVVVQPLILGFGTHDGKKYNTYRVWSKAVVWVRKDEEPAKITASGATKKKTVLQYFGVG